MANMRTELPCLEPHATSTDSAWTRSFRLRPGQCSPRVTIAARVSCPRADRDRRDAVAGQNISARPGTRWEPPALVTALGGFVPLTCAPLHLQKHSGVLAAEMRMHAWGSRGRRFKSGRPD